MVKFTELPVHEIMENVFDLIGEQWMLITAGTKDNYNTMTASWGGFGVLWNVPVAFIFIRPHRYTYNFVESNPYFTLTFFEQKHKDILNYCGSHSGKDVHKAKECGLVAMETENGNVYFEQAKMVVECSKLYHDDIDPLNFADARIQRNYPNLDYHRMYIGKIIRCLEKHK
jgi:flavin reductase (DIM6/NTAB) family NADH-FMN oxidoreductase RutF